MLTGDDQSPIDAVFTKENIDYPLLAPSIFSQDIFKINFMARDGCGLHHAYVCILREIEKERKEIEARARQEALKKQEEHAYHIKLVRERDRLLAMQYKKQQQLQATIKGMLDQADKMKRQRDDVRRRQNEKAKAEASRANKRIEQEALRRRQAFATIDRQGRKRELPTIKDFDGDASFMHLA